MLWTSDSNADAVGQWTLGGHLGRRLLFGFVGRRCGDDLARFIRRLLPEDADVDFETDRSSGNGSHIEPGVLLERQMDFDGGAYDGCGYGTDQIGETAFYDVGTDLQLDANGANRLCHEE